MDDDHPNDKDRANKAEREAAYWRERAEYLSDELHAITRETGNRGDGLVDWQRCVDRIQMRARAALIGGGCTSDRRTSIQELSVGVRNINVLKNFGVTFLDELGGISQIDLLRQPNYGQVSLDELLSAVSEYGVVIKRFHND